MSMLLYKYVNFIVPKLCPINQSDIVNYKSSYFYFPENVVNQESN